MRRVKLFKLPVLAAFAFFISCSPKPVAGPTVINIGEAVFIDIPLEQVLSKSDFLPLEFTPESALSGTAMFLNASSGYYLMDAYTKKTVFQFDKKGRFIRTVGKIGQGPGEYSQLTEALVTRNGLDILSGGPRTEVYKFDLDGRFIRTEQMLGQASNSFGWSPKNGDYYFYGSGYRNLIWQVDGKSLQPVDSFVNRNTSIMTPGVQAFSTTALGTVLFYQPFDDRIFELAEKSINLKYRFEVGISTPKYDDLVAESQTKMINERELWFIYKALENSKWLYLLVSQQVAMNEAHSQYYSLLVEKKSGKIYSLPDSPEPGPLFRPAFRLDEDNILYTAVQPEIVDKSDEWKAEFKKRDIALNPEGNYVVVKIPLGKIQISQ
jgi:hypothetical protein